MRADNRTEKSNKKKKRKKKRYFLRLLIILAICIGAFCLAHIEHFDLDGITVAGNKEISDEEIIKLSEIKKGESVFDAHTNAAERKIKKNLYIQDVKVKRKLPNMIEIVVEERTGKAQFANGKKFVIIDNEGKVLEISKEEKNVTFVENVTVKKAKEDKKIEVNETDIYDKAIAIIVAAEVGDIYFKRIVIEGKDVTLYVYDTLTCKGEYQDIMKAIESGAIKAVLFDLYQKGKEKGVITVGSNNYCSFTPKK